MFKTKKNAVYIETEKDKWQSNYRKWWSILGLYCLWALTVRSKKAQIPATKGKWIFYICKTENTACNSQWLLSNSLDMMETN